MKESIGILRKPFEQETGTHANQDDKTGHCDTYSLKKKEVNGEVSNIKVKV